MPYLPEMKLHEVSIMCCFILTRHSYLMKEQNWMKQEVKSCLTDAEGLALVN